MTKTSPKLFFILALATILSGCMAYEQADQLTESKLTAALDLKDPTLCLQLPIKITKPGSGSTDKGPPDIKEPQYKCLYEYAKQTGDILACNLTKHSPEYNDEPDFYIDQCRTKVAEVNSDTSICDQLDGPSAPGASVSCLAKASLDKNACNKVDHLRDRYYYQKYIMNECNEMMERYMNYYKDGKTDKRLKTPQK
jgi:hypothetical protein